MSATVSDTSLTTSGHGGTLKVLCELAVSVVVVGWFVGRNMIRISFGLKQWRQRYAENTLKFKLNGSLTQIIAALKNTDPQWHKIVASCNAS